jgi:hypothetical protein
MEKVIYCNDGSLAAMIARTNKSKKWDLFGISEIPGMGNADYNKKLFDIDFIEVITLNSFSGISYVCLNKSNKWGLLEVKDSETVHYEWNIFADFIYDDVDYMLNEMKIDRNEFR